MYFLKKFWGTCLKNTYIDFILPLRKTNKHNFYLANSIFPVSVHSLCKTYTINFAISSDTKEISRSKHTNTHKHTHIHTHTKTWHIVAKSSQKYHTNPADDLPSDIEALFQIALPKIKIINKEAYLDLKNPTNFGYCFNQL